MCEEKPASRAISQIAQLLLVAWLFTVSSEALGQAEFSGVYFGTFSGTHDSGQLGILDQMDGVVAELTARQPRPFDRVLAFLDVLLRFAPLIVEQCHPLAESPIEDPARGFVMTVVILSAELIPLCAA